MKRVGKCERCGECCGPEKDWSKFLKPTGIPVESKVTKWCPMLEGEEGDEVRLCSIYDSHHDFWERNCNPAPPPVSEWWEVLAFFENCPNCSFEFVEN